jgi:hypothetical protein
MIINVIGNLTFSRLMIRNQTRDKYDIMMALVVVDQYDSHHGLFAYDKAILVELW